MTHCFVICAYGDSPYLEACIQSLKKQIVSSPIYLETSTPSDFIYKLADKYHILVYENHGEKGITQDWNYAYDHVSADWVTIAHQDDIYLSNYTEDLLNISRNVKKPLIYFSDYGELRNGTSVLNNKNLEIKRILLTRLKSKRNWDNKRIRRLALAFGNSICCPSVSYYKKNLPYSLFFNNHFESNEDWEAWERFSRLDGAFIYNPKVSIYHRIHEQSATTKIIQKNHRSDEDYEMFLKFWPKGVARILTKIYSVSEKSNNI